MNKIEREALRLQEDWVKASADLEDYDSDTNYRAEQIAWDALVDFVESNNLNYTKYDPRGLA